jgi:hypothetical protein
MQTGFCRNGINFKASKDALIILRGFFAFKRCCGVKRQALAAGALPNRPEKVPHNCTLPESARLLRSVNATLTGGEIPHYKITGLKRFVPVSLRGWMKNEYYKKQALLAPATCTMINGLHKRVMAFFASCEHFRYSKRFDSWNENKSILTSYMGGGYRSWRKVQ